jgi:hypothetical protein
MNGKPKQRNNPEKWAKKVVFIWWISLVLAETINTPCAWLAVSDKKLACIRATFY